MDMISYGRQHIDEADIQAVVECLRSGALTQGPKVAEFEQAIAAYVGARYAVAVSNGTAALHLAAMAAELGPSSIVVTSPITFVASANAALYVRARPIFSDVDPQTINLSPSALAQTLAQNPDVKAIIPVHFSGLPCDMAAIKSAADRVGALIIEDAAHALGARYSDGRRVGACSHSLMTIFSFHPVKSITTGEGGMVTTNDEQVYRRLLRLRSHGINKGLDEFLDQDAAFTDGAPNPWYYEMQELSFNYRITDIQCALGITQLAKLDRFIERRRYLVSRYDRAFAASPLIRPIQLDQRDRSAHHLYPVMIDFAAAGISRADLMNRMREQGIITQVHYMPVPAHPYYRSLGHNPDHYPHGQTYYQRALSLPLFYGLTESQQDRVIAIMKELVP
jgi:UDP-4-amino-4,6-dideoxy-N-acetyl-beta-L-altrosamine transaminase